jgi:hypothetical protein
MNRLLSIARILVGVFLAVSVTDAHAGFVNVIIDNQLSNPVQRTIVEGDWWSLPPPELQQFTMDYGVIDFAISGNRKIVYADQTTGQACIFQVYGSWSASTGYSLTAWATSVGVEGGPYIQCSRSIDRSGSSPVVTFTLWSY